MAAAAFLPEDYVTAKILEVLGDADKVEDIQAQIDADELNRFGNITDEEEPIEEEQIDEE